MLSFIYLFILFQWPYNEPNPSLTLSSLSLMIKYTFLKLNWFILVLLAGLAHAEATENRRIAVLEFELKDMTLDPGIPAEIDRTASIKPLLENEIKKLGYEIVAINPDDQRHADAGTGYLFDHHDSAAMLAKRYDADYVIVGRLHKPSFLFMYLMAHLIEVKEAKLVGNYISEVKGGEKKLTLKGVESLAVKINQTLKHSSGP